VSTIKWKKGEIVTEFKPTVENPIDIYFIVWSFDIWTRRLYITALFYQELIGKLIVVDSAPQYQTHRDHIIDALTSIDLNAFTSRIDK